MEEEKLTIVKANSHLGDDISIGYGSTVDWNALLGDNCKFGENTVVAQNAEIQNDVRTAAGVYYGEDTTIGRKCEVENDATIKEGALIGNESHIGSRVLIGKNAVVPPGSTVDADQKVKGGRRYKPPVEPVGATNVVRPRVSPDNPEDEPAMTQKR